MLWAFFFAATLPRCCHAPKRLYINVFRKIRGSMAAKLRKKIFFQLIARTIINGTLFRNYPVSYLNKTITPHLRRDYGSSLMRLQFTIENQIPSTKDGILEVFGFCAFSLAKIWKYRFYFIFLQRRTKEVVIMSTLAMIQLICKLGLL